MVGSLDFWSGGAGYILSALITGGFGIFLARQNSRTHREVKTNHGKRQGERIEEMGDDLAQVKRTMVTQQDLREHADHDNMIASQIFSQVADLKALVIAVIGGKSGKD